MPRAGGDSCLCISGCPGSLELPGAIPGLRYRLPASFVPLWGNRDGDGGRNPPPHPAGQPPGETHPSPRGAGELPSPSSARSPALRLSRPPWKWQSQRFAKRIKASPAASWAAPASLTPRAAFPRQTPSRSQTLGQGDDRRAAARPGGCTAGPERGLGARPQLPPRLTQEPRLEPCGSFPPPGIFLSLRRSPKRSGEFISHRLGRCWRC